MDEYYINQAGSGIGGFSGTRYQKGDGFFGRLVSGTILPLVKKVLPYLGRTALNAGLDIASDVADGEKFKSSFKKRMKSSAEKVGADAMAKIQEVTGSGKRRRRRRRGKKPVATKVRKASGKRKPARKKQKKKKAIDFL